MIEYQVSRNDWPFRILKQCLSTTKCTCTWLYEYDALV